LGIQKVNYFKDLILLDCLNDKGPLQYVNGLFCFRKIIYLPGILKIATFAFYLLIP